MIFPQDAISPIVIVVAATKMLIIDSSSCICFPSLVLDNEQRSRF